MSTLSFPDIICQTIIFYVDTRVNIKYCKICYDRLKCAFTKFGLRKQFFHTSIDRNSESFIYSEICVIKCDVCKKTNLNDVSYSDEIIDERCDICRDFSADLDTLIQEIIECKLLPPQVKLVGDLIDYKAYSDRMNSHK